MSYLTDMVVNLGMECAHHYKPRQDLLPGKEDLGSGRLKPEAVWEEVRCPS